MNIMFVVTNRWKAQTLARNPSRTVRTNLRLIDGLENQGHLVTIHVAESGQEDYWGGMELSAVWVDELCNPYTKEMAASRVRKPAIRDGICYAEVPFEMMQLTMALVGTGV